MDIIEQLDDLIVQATKERSHYYVASVARTARLEIIRTRALSAALAQLLDDKTVADLFRKHIVQP